jgi:hypothetical protein
MRSMKLDKSGKEMNKVYFYNFETGDNVMAMHIHLGMPGQVGEHVVTLCGLPEEAGAPDCTDQRVEGIGKNCA